MRIVPKANLSIRMLSDEDGEKVVGGPGSEADGVGWRLGLQEQKRTTFS
jgi:hypothetical protein